MSLNRYSKLPTINIRNTQVLPDLGILDSTLARKQKSYDETASNISKFQSQVSGLQGYGDAAKQYISQIDEDVKNTVASVANQDLGSPEVKNKLNGYVQSIYGDKKLQEIQKVNELRTKQEEQLQDLAAKGKLSQSQEYIFNKAWDSYSKTGQVNKFIQEPLMEAADLVSERGKLVSMIKASGRDAIKYLSNGMAYKENSKGVSGSKIAKAVDEQLNTYANSHAGRQERMDFEMLKDQGAIPKSTTFKDYLRKEVMSTAKNYEYSDYSTNRDGAENARRKENKEEELMLTGTEEFNFSGTPKDTKYNSDGTPRSTQSMYSKFFGTAFGDAEMTEEERSNPNYKSRELGAKALGVTVEEYDNMHKNKVSVPVWNYVNKTKRENLSSLLTDEGAGIINSAKILDKDNNASTLRDVIIKKYDLGSDATNGDITETLKKEGVQITGRVEPSAGAADGYRISMGGEDYILDLTESLGQKIQSGKHTKDDVARLQKYEEELFKNGHAEEVKTKEGNFIKFWNPNTNSIDFKENN